MLNGRQSSQKTGPPKPPPTLENRFERWARSDRRAETAVVNATRIPENLISAALGFDSSAPTSKEGDLLNQQKNFTNLNEPDVKKRLEEAMEPQDEKQKSIQDIRRQIDFLRKEENRARELIDEEEEKKKREEEEILAQKKQEEEERQQREAQQAEPSTKQQRGLLFGKKKKPNKTMENRAGSGKN